MGMPSEEMGGEDRRLPDIIKMTPTTRVAPVMADNRRIFRCMEIDFSLYFSRNNDFSQ
jgi:hypothetical protein